MHVDIRKPAGDHGIVHQSGVTLVEFMISLGLSLIVVLAATSLLLSSKSAYTVNDDAVMIQENGRYALESIARALRQSGYDDWDGDGVPGLTEATDSANIIGLDARSLKSTTAAMNSPVAKSVNGSDVLGIRFHGAGDGEHGDGTMLNCAGFAVGSGSKKGSPSERGWSIFYVAEDAAGEPELRCKYQGKNAWSAVAIARGVESFQVLYGLDTDADGLPNQFITATQVDKLDDGLVLVGADSVALALDKSRKTHWKKIVALKVALLIRGAHPARADELEKSYALFGKDYRDAYGNIDTGTWIEEKKLPVNSRNRIRKVFSATIMLRNQSIGEPA
jgi:type IV pilus assembly protein PilW